MKSLAFLEQVDHTHKAAIYAAEHDGKVRNFAYHEELGECRETFARLLEDVQKGEIGVILTPDAACLAIETSPGWVEAFPDGSPSRRRIIGAVQIVTQACHFRPEGAHCHAGCRV